MEIKFKNNSYIKGIGCTDETHRSKKAKHIQLFTNAKVKRLNEKFSYGELRSEIHKILYDFFIWELECDKGNEFDHEWMEHTTDKILRLIEKQGGTRW